MSNEHKPTVCLVCDHIDGLIKLSDSFMQEKDIWAVFKHSFCDDIIPCPECNKTQYGVWCMKVMLDWDKMVEEWLTVEDHHREVWEANPPSAMVALEHFETQLMSDTSTWQHQPHEFIDPEEADKAMTELAEDDLGLTDIIGSILPDNMTVDDLFSESPAFWGSAEDEELFNSVITASTQTLDHELLDSDGLSYSARDGDFKSDYSPWKLTEENICLHPSCGKLWSECVHGFSWTNRQPRDIWALGAQSPALPSGDGLPTIAYSVQISHLVRHKITLTVKDFKKKRTQSHSLPSGHKIWSLNMIDQLVMLEQIAQAISASSYTIVGVSYTAAQNHSLNTTRMAKSLAELGINLKRFRRRFSEWLCDCFGSVERHLTSEDSPSFIEQYEHWAPHTEKRDEMSVRFLEARASVMQIDDIWCGDQECMACVPELVETLTTQFLPDVCMAWSTQNEEGEEIMVKTMIGNEVKAKRILNKMMRFNNQRMAGSGSNSDRERMRRQSAQQGFLNTLRCSEKYLKEFIGIFMRNTTRKQAENIMRQQLAQLLAKGDLTSYKRGKASKCLDEAIESYYETKKPTKARATKTTEAERLFAIDYLTEVFAGVCHAVIDKHIAMDWTLHPFHWEKDELGLDTGAGPRDVLDTIFSNQHVMRSLFMQAYLTFDNDEAMTMPISQKAKSIRAIGLSQDRLSLFQSPVSHYIELQSAVKSSNRDLLMSLSRAFGGRVNRLLENKLYIRTCPATPRPGVLPNIEATDPSTYVEGVKSTALSMLDPEHPDYDPEGCIVVQKWVKPLCSGVMALGNGEFTIAFGNAGSTAGEGSEVVFSLNPTGQRQLAYDIKQLGLKDGMDHHEIEFVYQNTGTRSNLTWFKKVACQRHNAKGIRRNPMITQVRGLHAPKPPLSPPPVIEGEALIYRGNVPVGSVVQATSINVGQGSLQECFELEKMGKEDTLPEGLVVYAPSGSPSAHVAGVSLEFEFPVVYGIKPQRDGTVWTEIEGWVTDIEGAEPQPYDPSPLTEFYKIGLRDGDRYWAYNLAGMSQFFHNFISGPRNDPRLEAYLAGVYTTWIIKAALGVAMGEFRHGISGKADFTPQRTFAHMAMQTAISGEANCKNYFSRSDYYRRLNFNEIGYDVLHTLCKFYTDSYDANISPWHGSSYGGKKYQAAIKPSVKACEMIKRLLQGGDINFNLVLAQVNQLESAVHNTGFFFNKFLGDKSAFDIGTGGHANLSHAIEHWITVMPYYSMFYHQYVNEPHRVAIKHRQLHTTLIKQAASGQKTLPKMMGEVSTFDEIAFEGGVLRSVLQKRTNAGDISADSASTYEKTMSKHGDVRLHRLGICGFSGCPMQECKSMHMLDELGLSEEQLDLLVQKIQEYREFPVYYYEANNCYSPDHAMQKVQSRGARAIEQAVFVERERLLEETGVEMTEHQVGSNPENVAYVITKFDYVKDPETGERIKTEKHFVYADHVFSAWCKIVKEHINKEEMWDDPVKAFRQWLTPPKTIDGDLFKMMSDIVVLVESHNADLWTAILRKTPGKKLYPTSNPVEEDDDISNLLEHYLKGMLCYHQGHAVTDTHTLCMALKSKGILKGVIGDMKQ